MPETGDAPPRGARSQARRPTAERQQGAASGPGTSGRDAPLYGALDLGTNNCRLLIARPARDGFRVVDSFSRIVRLGEGLSRTGRLDEAAMDRAYEALVLCGERVARKGLEPERLMAVATQACRQAGNGEAFIERVRVGTGLKLRIIDPVEEARLAVEGCLNLFDSRARAVLVVDVGGGSTELSWLKKTGDGRFETVGWMSAPIGVVTLAERHPEPRGAAADALADWYEAMVVEIVAAISKAPVDPDLRRLFVSGEAHMVGTSGAITSLAGIHLGLRRYQRNLVDGLWMTRGDCDAAAARLKAMGHDGRAAESCIGPDRADLVLAGAAIMEAVQREWPSERVRVADRGLREGLLLGRIREDQKPRRRRRRRGRRDQA
jgi:exopolyphosphatase/guanosine-5'-triphosphate,3'-diphosphate pyrophosphatase